METTVREDNWKQAERFAMKASAAAIFAFLTALSAHIRIPLPFTPIPMTLQTFIVPLAGGFLGAVWGGTAMLFYVLLGLLGLDVFAAAQGGVGFFIAPSAGYLIGYIPAAAMVGYARRRFQSSAALLLSLLFSFVIVFMFGMSGLIFNANMNLSQAFYQGVAPFLVGDFLKLTAAFLILHSYKTIRNSRNGMQE